MNDDHKSREQLITELQSQRARIAELEQRDLDSEAALMDSEGRNRALLEAIPDMIFRLRRDGTYTEFVRAERFRTYTVPVDELVGTTLHHVLPVEIADEYLRLIAETLDSGQARAYEYALVFDDGSTREYEGRIAACAADEVLVIVRDITEWKRSVRELRAARDQLEQQNRHLTRVLEFVGATLDHMTESARRGATQGEFLNYLIQARSQFEHLH